MLSGNAISLISELSGTVQKLKEVIDFLSFEPRTSININQSSINNNFDLSPDQGSQAISEIEKLKEVVSSLSITPSANSGAKLSSGNDVNVTLTLSGAPNGCLLQDAAIQAGWTGQLSVPRGGTGLSTLTQNGVLFGNGAANIGVTAAGVTGQVLVANTGAAPTWGNISGISVTTISFGTTGLTPAVASGGAITVSGTLVAANGGTGFSSYVVGDMLYANTTTSFAKLAIGTNNFMLGSTGSAPIWVQNTGTGNAVRATLPTFTSTLGVGNATASASGAGITFPAIQSASTNVNTLDDYEEGAFAGVFGLNNSAGAWTSANGTYTKIGRVVYINITLVGTNMRLGGGYYQITGLPFAAIGVHCGTYGSSQVNPNQIGGRCVVFNSEIWIYNAFNNNQFNSASISCTYHTNT